MTAILFEFLPVFCENDGSARGGQYFVISPGAPTAYPAALGSTVCMARRNPGTSYPSLYTDRGFTVQLNATTQVDGANTPLRKALLYQGRVVRELSGNTDDVLLDMEVGAEYELLVLGGGAKRSEVWGPTAIPAPVPFELSGSLAACSSGVAYSSGLTATGGNGTKTWDISGQALPTGLSFSTSSGLITGTTTVTGTTLHTIGVYDGNGLRRWKDVVLVVS